MNKEPQELFAIVPQALIACRRYSPTEKLIITHLLAKHQIQAPNGEPWTFSVPSIAKATALSERTISRHISRLLTDNLLKFYGTKRNYNVEYNIYTFCPAALPLILTDDNLSVIKRLQSQDITTMDGLTMDKLSDKLSDKVPPKKKIIEERVVKPKKEDNSIIRLEGGSESDRVPSEASSSTAGVECVKSEALPLAPAASANTSSLPLPANVEGKQVGSTDKQGVAGSAPVDAKKAFFIQLKADADAYEQRLINDGTPKHLIEGKVSAYVMKASSGFKPAKKEWGQ